MSATQTSEPVPEHPHREPPTHLRGVLLMLGPGLILVGNIVGSGELIATPALSAEAGFTFLWLILFSCFIKVFFQIEIGRYAISEGRTTLESFNDLPGPRFGVNWLLWYWLFMMIASLVQIGGMCGGVAQALRIAMPIWSAEAGTNDTVWSILTGLSVIALLTVGRYRMVERVALLLVTMFTLITFYSVFQLQQTTSAVTLDDIRTGFRFTFPEGANRGRLLGLALMAFGITGVGASELVAYPYWCLEKGYGRFVGKKSSENDQEWIRRAKGWIKVMHYDAWFSMAVFTIATLAFYVLGAALLYPLFKANPDDVPKGTQMVQVLSNMYSKAFAEYAKYVFLVGAICVLYSTFFIATAANSRMFADWLGIIGAYDKNDQEKRQFFIRLFCVLFPVFVTSAYLYLEKPVIMVMVSGVMQAMMLPLIGFAVFYLALKRTHKQLLGGKVWFATLWISFALMTATSLYGAFGAVKSLFAP